MLRNLLLLLLTAAVFWLAVDLLVRDQQQLSRVPVESPPTPDATTVPDKVEPDRVLDINVKSVAELDALLSRVEELLERPLSNRETPLISLVLHGPEVEFFAFKNYDRYKPIVDRAAKLAALGAVDISICQTQMRAHGIGPDEVPAFLNQVPFGPDEVERLVNEGFVYM